MPLPGAKSWPIGFLLKVLAQLLDARSALIVKRAAQLPKDDSSGKIGAARGVFEAPDGRFPCRD
jgi:hypothetical protein